MRILVAGATGLVGQGVLRTCLNDPSVSYLATLVRRPGSGTTDASTGQPADTIEEILAPDFHDLSAVNTRLQPFDACFYCAGARPIGVAEAQYRRVTVDLTCHVAHTLSQHNAALRFIYVSGLGANPHSRVMPMRVKGEAEAALAALPLRSICLRTGGIQPVQGERSPHPALAAFYRLGSPLMGLGLPLAPGLITTTAHVGRAMLALARMPDPPAIVENRTINHLGNNSTTL